MAFDIVYNIIATDRFSKHANKIGKSVNKMSRDIDRFNTNLHRTGSRMKKAESSFLRMGRGAKRAAGNMFPAFGIGVRGGIAAGLGLIGLKAVQTGAQFERSMNMVQAVSNATTEQFKQLEKQAERLGATTQFTASQVAQGQKFLAMAGKSVNEILKATPAALNLAAATQTDFGTAADIVTNIMSAYTMKASKLNRANDVIVATTTNANVNMQELAQSIKLVGPLAKGAGIDFVQLNAILGVLSQSGIKDTRAATSLKNAIKNMLSPTKKMREVMKQGNITFKDSHGKLKSMDKIVKELRKSGINMAGMFQIFGLRGALAMKALKDSGSEAITKLQKKINELGGVTQRISKVQTKGLTGAWLKLKSAAQGVGITISKLLEPALLNTADSITKALLKTNKLLESFQRLNIVDKIPKNMQKGVKVGFNTMHAALKNSISLLDNTSVKMQFLKSLFAKAFPKMGAHINENVINPLKAIDILKTGYHPFNTITHKAEELNLQPMKMHSRVDINLNDPGQNVQNMKGTTNYGDLNLNLGQNMAFSR